MMKEYYAELAQWLAQEILNKDLPIRTSYGLAVAVGALPPLPSRPVRELHVEDGDVFLVERVDGAQPRATRFRLSDFS